MNQSIQILDGFQYVSQFSAMRIDALNAGQLVPCFIKDIDEASSNAFYETNQFDIEEVLVDLIEDEKWNEKGEVWLSALDVTY